VMLVVMVVLVWGGGPRTCRPSTGSRDADGCRRRTVRVAAIAVVARGRALAGGTCPTAVHFHVFPQRAGVRITLVAPRHPAVVRLVGRVNV